MESRPPDTTNEFVLEGSNADETKEERPEDGLDVRELAVDDARARDADRQLEERARHRRELLEPRAEELLGHSGKGEE